MQNNTTIEGYRLSPQQSQIWKVQERARNARCTVLIEGQLNVKSVRLAIEKVIERHEILRTTFQRIPGMDTPLQVINESGRLGLCEYELSHLDAEHQQARLESLFQQLGQSFDLEESPTLQTALVSLSPFKHVLMFALPSLCADRISFENLTSEISLTYAACLRGEVVEDEPMQYADVSGILNDLLESEDTKAGREYWQKYAGEDSLEVHLPFLQESNVSERFNPQVVSVSHGSEVANKLDDRTRQFETTNFNFILTCWATLLYRFSGQAELIVGAAFDGRSFEGLSGAIGPLARFLPVRCQFTDDAKFSQILKQVAETTGTLVK